jgi:hypothetical protein
MGQNYWVKVTDPKELEEKIAKSTIPYKTFENIKDSKSLAAQMAKDM